MKEDKMHHSLEKIKEKWNIGDELEYEIRHAMANYAVCASLRPSIRDEAVQIASNESFDKFLNDKSKESIFIKD